MSWDAKGGALTKGRHLPVRPLPYISNFSFQLFELDISNVPYVCKIASATGLLQEQVGGLASSTVKPISIPRLRRLEPSKRSYARRRLPSEETIWCRDKSDLGALSEKEKRANIVGTMSLGGTFCICSNKMKIIIKHWVEFVSN